MRNQFKLKLAFWCLFAVTIALTIAAIFIPSLAVLAGAVGGADIVLWEKVYADKPEQATFHMEHENIGIEMLPPKEAVYVQHNLLFTLIKKLSFKEEVKPNEAKEEESGDSEGRHNSPGP